MWNGSKISTVDEDIEALLSRIEQSHHAVKRRGNDAGPGFSLIPRASPRSQPVEGTNTNISITPDATPRSVTTSRSQTFGEHTGSTLGVSQALNTFIPKIENIRECLQFSLNDQYRNLEKKFERLESLMVEQKSSFTESNRKDKSDLIQTLSSAQENMEALKSTFCEGQLTKNDLQTHIDKLREEIADTVRSDLGKHIESLRNGFQRDFLASRSSGTGTDSNTSGVSSESQQLLVICERNMDLQLKLEQTVHSIASKLDTMSNYGRQEHLNQEEECNVLLEIKDLKATEKKLHDLGFDESWTHHDFDGLDQISMEIELREVEGFVKIKRELRSNPSSKTYRNQLV